MIVAGYFTTEAALEVNREEERKMFEICAIAPTDIVCALASVSAKRLCSHLPPTCPCRLASSPQRSDYCTWTWHRCKGLLS